MCVAQPGYINRGEDIINWSNIRGSGTAYQFMELFLGTNHRANYFQKNLRYFNSGMAMASLKAGKDATIQGNGPGIYRIKDVGAITAYEGCTNPRW